METNTKKDEGVAWLIQTLTITNFLIWSIAGLWAGFKSGCQGGDIFCYHPSSTGYIYYFLFVIVPTVILSFYLRPKFRRTILALSLIPIVVFVIILALSRSRNPNFGIPNTYYPVKSWLQIFGFTDRYRQ